MTLANGDTCSCRKFSVCFAVHTQQFEHLLPVPVHVLLEHWESYYRTLLLLWSDTQYTLYIHWTPDSGLIELELLPIDSSVDLQPWPLYIHRNFIVALPPSMNPFPCETSSVSFCVCQWRGCNVNLWLSIDKLVLSICSSLCSRHRYWVHCCQRTGVHLLQRHHCAKHLLPLCLIHHGTTVGELRQCMEHTCLWRSRQHQMLVHVHFNI